MNAPDPSASLPPDADSPLPARLDFSVGGYGGPSYRLEWADGLLNYSYWPPSRDEAPAQVERLSPSPAAWTRFWADLGDVGIERWSARYKTPGVMDGTHWMVDLASRELTVSTHGSNCYPTATVLSDGPAVRDAGSTDTAAVWDAFCEAVKRLSGREFR